MKEKELIVTCEYNKEPQDIKKIHTAIVFDLHAAGAERQCP